MCKINSIEVIISNSAVSNRIAKARMGFGEVDGSTYIVLSSRNGGYFFKKKNLVGDAEKKYSVCAAPLGYGQARALCALLEIQGRAQGMKTFEKWNSIMSAVVCERADRAERRDAAKDEDNVIKARIEREATEAKNAKRLEDARKEQDAIKAQLLAMQEAIAKAKEEKERKEREEREREERERREAAIKAERDAADANTKKTDEAISAIREENASIMAMLEEMKKELEALKG